MRFINVIVFPVVLLLATLLVKSSSGICRDKFALNSVDALVHVKRHSRGELQKGKDINDFDGYTMIDVVGSNVTQLCEGMIKNFPVLQTLSLINANISSIEPGTFRDVPRLEDLSLAVNQLTHIPQGVFNTISSLKVLYLSKNQIETIEDAAFAEMPHLKTIHLDHNKIKQLTGNILFGSRKLTFVDYSHNLLKVIQNNALDDLQYATTRKRFKLHLQRNRIETIERSALEKLKFPVELNLDFNEIIGVSSIVLPLQEGSAVSLRNNQIDCISDEVLTFIKNNEVTVNIPKNPVQCTCVERVDDVLGDGLKGEINVQSTLPCSYSNPFFGNQI